MNNASWLKIWVLILLVVAALSCGLDVRAYVAPVQAKGSELPPQDQVELLPWVKIDQLIPKFAKVKVIDVESGLSFRVQRRGGDSHADMQPLTRADSRVMKRIYGGEWSWNRRAVIVQKGRRFFAASMNGMPHGKDGIPGNEFSGHFCIHFLDSRTHGSDSKDLVHQLMVYKAAGKWEQYMSEISPYDVIDVFFTAINIQEPRLLRLCFTRADHRQIDYLLEDSGRISAIRLSKPYDIQDFDNALTLQISAQVNAVRRGIGETQMTMTFQLVRVTVLEPWKISGFSIIG